MENIFVVTVEVDYEGSSQQYVFLDETSARGRFEALKGQLDRGEIFDQVSLVKGTVGVSLCRGERLDEYRPDEDRTQRSLMLGLAATVAKASGW